MDLHPNLAKDHFTDGLKALFADDTWRSRAVLGFEYINQVFAVDKAIKRHLEIYRQLLA